MNYREIPNIRQRTLELLQQIPWGYVTSYKDLAVALGDERAARAVGKIMAQNAKPETYPCWKVVHSSGEVGKYSSPRGVEEKISRMNEQGISVCKGHVENFPSVRFSKFEIDPPLPELRQKQECVAKNAALQKLNPNRIRRAGGVDVGYREGQAKGCYVEVMLPQLEPVYSCSLKKEEIFPYVPTYLAFRELPVLGPLLEKVDRERGLPPAIFVDGNGLLHPRSSGLATHLGVSLDWSTIGIAKSLLCGKVKDRDLSVGESTPVIREEKTIGYAFKNSPRAKPIFVSVGNKIDLNSALKLTEKFSKYKLPHPVHLAHRLARDWESSTL